MKRFAIAPRSGAGGRLRPPVSGKALPVRGTHVLHEPMTFLERLAALVPRPRAHLVTYHGVLAPAPIGRRWCLLEIRLPGPAAAEVMRVFLELDGTRRKVQAHAAADKNGILPTWATSSARCASRLYEELELFDEYKVKRYKPASKAAPA